MCGDLAEQTKINRKLMEMLHLELDQWVYFLEIPRQSCLTTHRWRFMSLWGL